MSIEVKGLGELAKKLAKLGALILLFQTARAKRRE